MEVDVGEDPAGAVALVAAEGKPPGAADHAPLAVADPLAERVAAEGDLDVRAQPARVAQFVADLLLVGEGPQVEYWLRRGVDVGERLVADAARAEYVDDAAVAEPPLGLDHDVVPVDAREPRFVDGEVEAREAVGGSGSRDRRRRSRRARG